MTEKKKPGRKKGKGIPSKKYQFRMRPTRDKDYVDWLDSMADGERSETIRVAVREMFDRLNKKPVQQIISQPIARSYFTPEPELKRETPSILPESKVDKKDSEKDWDSALDGLGRLDEE